MTIVLPAAAALPPAIDATVVTVGTFDGVHRGHLDLLARLVARGRERGWPSLLVTFDPHPLELLNPEAAPRLLTTRDEKLAALTATGLDYVAILPFDRPLAAIPAPAFVEQVLCDRFRVGELLIGHDHGFGRGREGGVDTMRRVGAARGFAVEVVAPVCDAAGLPISSSRIRRALEVGDVRQAADALGREYTVAGRVVAGAGRGRTLGYPTLNVLPGSPRKLLPANGVYAVRVATGAGEFGGMLNLGGRPTFDESAHAIEAHLFDAGGDFYGDAVAVGFVARLRETRRFDGPAALTTQLADDARAARRALTASGEPGNLKGSMQVPPSTP
jgi:riboflavin kinase/FMN adenylyltransferase